MQTERAVKAAGFDLEGITSWFAAAPRQIVSGLCMDFGQPTRTEPVTTKSVGLARLGLAYGTPELNQCCICCAQMIAEEKVAMPWMSYFGSVGICLIGLLFLTDAYLPKVAQRIEPEQQYDIRVRSKKAWPEAVTFTGHSIDYGVRHHLEIVDERAAASRVRAAFASGAPNLETSSSRRRAGVHIGEGFQHNTAKSTPRPFPKR